MILSLCVKRPASTRVQEVKIKKKRLDVKKMRLDVKLKHSTLKRIIANRQNGLNVQKTMILLLKIIGFYLTRIPTRALFLRLQD